MARQDSSPDAGKGRAGVKNKQQKLTDKMILDAVKILDKANLPSEDRIFYIRLDTPEDEQRYAQLMGWA